MSDYYGEHWLRVMRLQDDVAPVSEQQAVAAVRLAGCPQGTRILDSACGFGRHLRSIVREGYEVIGSDLSMALIQEASKVEGATVLQADYRRLPFAESSFAAVLNLFTSFGFYGRGEDTGVLREFRRVLRPGGVLLVQVQHRDRLMCNFRAVEDHRLSPDVSLEVRREFDAATGVQRLTEVVTDSSGVHPPVEVILTVYSAEELSEMAVTAGFAKVQLLGGFDGRPFDPDQRAIIKGTVV
jgi:ubiquinone/menaquinone biosynthesis C-methylase UbiE